MAELSRRSAVRIGFAAGIVLGLVFLGVSFATASEATTSTAQDQSRLSASERHSIAPPTENVTVVAGQGFGDQPGDAITAFRPDGRLLRYNDTYDEYHDVDPVEGTSHTVLYVAANHVDADTCGATVKCTVSVIETMNLSTGRPTACTARSRRGVSGTTPTTSTASTSTDSSSPTSPTTECSSSTRRRRR
ncbi:hypothetical protein ACFQL4_10880 [Halosimplex aquaticum]